MLARRMAHTISMALSSWTNGPVRSWGVALKRVARHSRKRAIAQRRVASGFGQVSASSVVRPLPLEKPARRRIASGTAGSAGLTHARRNTARIAGLRSAAARPGVQLGRLASPKTKTGLLVRSLATTRPTKGGRARRSGSARRSQPLAVGQAKIAPRPTAVATRASLV